MYLKTVLIKLSEHLSLLYQWSSTYQLIVISGALIKGDEGCVQVVFFTMPLIMLYKVIFLANKIIHIKNISNLVLINHTPLGGVDTCLILNTNEKQILQVVKQQLILVHMSIDCAFRK